MFVACALIKVLLGNVARHSHCGKRLSGFLRTPDAHSPTVGSRQLFGELGLWREPDVLVHGPKPAETSVQEQHIGATECPPHTSGRGDRAGHQPTPRWGQVTRGWAG